MKNNLVKIFLFIAIIAGISVAYTYRDQINAAVLEQWVNDAGAAGPIVFMLIYIVGTVLFFPGAVLTLAGGALFGPYWGTFYNLTGATIGAFIAFLTARYLASGWVESKVGGRMKQLKQGVEAEGWRFVAFVRLVPFFPFNLLNYALGLTRIPSWHYLWASYVFMLPGAIAYTYLGYAGREAIGGSEGLVQKITLALTLLALVGFLPSLIGRFRRGPVMAVTTLHEKLDTGPDMLVLDVRETEELSGELGHITQAKNIPFGELPRRLDEISDYQERTVAIVCRTDRRSAKAAQLLARNGYADVHIVQGGMTAWRDAGFAVEK